MSENCNHDCSSCGATCGDRTEPQSLLAPANPNSHIKKVIAVMSGKGGVGKSLVTSMMAVTMQRRGYKTAVLDADITGPSIPKVFHLKGKVTGTELGMTPAVTKSGIKIMSTNLILDNETDPVVWRGPILGGVVKQFWSDVNWGEVDYMFVDMPPGTGDVPLTVYQSLPRKSVFSENEYFSIVTTSKQYQVIRFFFVKSRYKAGQAAEYSIYEVVQRWISPKGTTTTVARLRGMSMLYYDQWAEYSDMEVRKNNGLHAYDIAPMCTYP